MMAEMNVKRRAAAVISLLSIFLVTLYIVRDSHGSEPWSASQISFFTTASKHFDVHRYVPYIFVDSGAPLQVLRRHHYNVKFVPLPTTFNDQALRVALWDHSNVPTAVFAGPPGFNNPVDFLAWLSSGRNAVFLGGYGTLTAMNQLFGFELEYVPYVPGPYWQNDRNVRGTPFEYGPKRLEETGTAYGVNIDSIPLTGYSMYDTQRVSLVFYIKYNQGTVCYIGSTFQDLDEADPWGVVLRAAVRM